MSIRGLLLRLPPANYAVLEYIVAHLHRSVQSGQLLLLGPVFPQQINLPLI